MTSRDESNLGNGVCEKSGGRLNSIHSFFHGGKWEKNMSPMWRPQAAISKFCHFLFSPGILAHPPYQTYGGFLKCGYPKIIHFNRIFHCKSSILGYHHWWKSPYRPKHVSDSKPRLFLSDLSGLRRSRSLWRTKMVAT